MPELAVSDGLPPPSNLPLGEFIVWPTGTDDQFTIRRADPRILISTELIDQISAGQIRGDSPWAEIDWSGQLQNYCYVGAMVKITGINQRVIYRLTECLPRINAYIGEWPD